MTIAEKLQQVNEIKGQIRDAVNQMGGNLSSSAPFSEYPDAVLSIPQEIVQGGTGWNDDWVIWIPQMTSNTSPEPYVVSGDIEYYSSGSPWYPFNTNSNSIDLQRYSSSELSQHVYIQFDFGEETTVYGIALFSNDYDYTINGFRVSGSNDGENWIVIQDVASRHIRDTYFEGIFSNPATYRYYKFTDFILGSSYGRVTEIYFIRDKQSVGEES